MHHPTGMKKYAPFAFVVNNELEHAVPIGCTERHRVLAGLAANGRESGPDVRV